MAFSNDLNLVLKVHLDYEVTKYYELYLVAKDNGGLKAVKRLTIRVIDENDNSPVCEKSLFIESVYENEAARRFLQIRASDADSGLNGQLHYSIDVSNTETVQSLFEIDSRHGWLSAKQPLDYEKRVMYDLIVKVNDSNENNSFTTYCTARLNVLDVNDNPARLKIIKYLNESVQHGYYSLNTIADVKGQAEAQVEIVENGKAELVLALLRVFDHDSLSNYKFGIRCSATNANADTSLLEMRMSDRSSREYELVAMRPFDAEESQTFSVQIDLYDLQGGGADDDGLMFKKRPPYLGTTNNNRYGLLLYKLNFRKANFS